MDKRDITFRTQYSRGYAIAVISAGILSTTAIFIRYLTETYQIPALILAFWRGVFVVLTLLVGLGVLSPSLLRVNRPHLSFLAFFGLILAVFNALWTISVAVNGASLATVLVYSSAAFTAVLGWWLLGEQLSWIKTVAIILCMVGIFLVAGTISGNGYQSDLFGVVSGVLSGLGYAIYSLMGRSASQRGLNPWTTLFYTFGFAAIYLLGINLIPGLLIPGATGVPKDLLWLGTSLAGWGVLILLAAGPTVAGFGLYNVSLSLLPSSVANLILTLEPVFTAMLAYILLGERMSLVQILGSLMILSGVVFLRIYRDDRS